MLHRISLEDILFLDIETVPEVAHYNNLDEDKQKLWDHKAEKLSQEDEAPDEVFGKAGLYAEFGKIICISVGFFTDRGNERQFRTKSFFGEEAILLQEFKNLLDTHYRSPNKLLCGHNAKEFDFPFIARRMLIHGIALPEKLNLFGKKPWEIPHLDTMELWKFGSFRHFTSLKLLANILNVPSPKDDIDGSMVAQVYYEENDLDRIIRYCEKDVVATAQVFLRLRNEKLLTEDDLINV